MLTGHLTQRLAEAVLGTFPSTRLATRRRVPPDHATPAVVRRAVDFIDANAERDLTTSDIAAAAGIGPRGLQAAFLRHQDSTPTAYAEAGATGPCPPGAGGHRSRRPRHRARRRCSLGLPPDERVRLRSPAGLRMPTRPDPARLRGALLHLETRPAPVRPARQTGTGGDDRAGELLRVDRDGRSVRDRLGADGSHPGGASPGIGRTTGPGADRTGSQRANQGERARLGGLGRRGVQRLLPDVSAGPPREVRRAARPPHGLWGTVRIRRLGVGRQAATCRPRCGRESSAEVQRRPHAPAPAGT